MAPEVLGGVLTDGFFQVAIQTVEDGFDVFVLISAPSLLDQRREIDFEFHGSDSMARGEA